MSYNEKSRPKDNIVSRGIKKGNPLGTGLFLGLRSLDPFLQYGILAQGLGSSIIEKLGGRTLSHGPSLITDTIIDRLGLSPYRLILLAMATGSAIKQNYWLIGISSEEMPPGPSIGVSVFNTIFNSANDLLFTCSLTSASVNGEHFPQTPLMVGTGLYTVGILTETLSEWQRKKFKQNPANKSKVYEGGLFGLSRHVNYFGYTLWRAGYALAAGGWTWGAVTGAFFAWDFLSRAIPVLSHYCEERVRMSMVCMESELIVSIVRRAVGALQAADALSVCTFPILDRFSRDELDLPSYILGALLFAKRNAWTHSPLVGSLRHPRMV